MEELARNKVNEERLARDGGVMKRRERGSNRGERKQYDEGRERASRKGKKAKGLEGNKSNKGKGIVSAGNEDEGKDDVLERKKKQNKGV